ncbi:hypothetical protein D5086_012213 [Populus alba]|uniref:Uncharacterized protein n=2 Tax=Populus alba TaxID=43335 RepID=A0ACC4C1V3_POPAL|nr:hypothetical protein D5086_0000090790 [Populus alba]
MKSKTGTGRDVPRNLALPRHRLGRFDCGFYGELMVKKDCRFIFLLSLIPFWLLEEIWDLTCEERESLELRDMEIDVSMAIQWEEKRCCKEEMGCALVCLGWCCRLLAWSQCGGAEAEKRSLHLCCKEKLRDATGVWRRRWLDVAVAGAFWKESWFLS